MTDAYVVDERRGFYLSVWKETVAILFFVFCFFLCSIILTALLQGSFSPCASQI